MKGYPGMQQFAPTSYSQSQHHEAMHYINELTLMIKVKQNGETWDNLPELDEKYFMQWLSFRTDLLTCEDVNIHGNIIQTHQQAVNIVDTMIGKVGSEQKLTLSELSLLEDVHRELSQCGKYRVWY